MGANHTAGRQEVCVRVTAAEGIYYHTTAPTTECERKGVKAVVVVVKVVVMVVVQLVNREVQ